MGVRDKIRLTFGRQKEFTLFKPEVKIAVLLFKGEKAIGNISPANLRRWRDNKVQSESVPFKSLERQGFAKYCGITFVVPVRGESEIFVFPTPGFRAC